MSKPTNRPLFFPGDIVMIRRGRILGVICQILNNYDKIAEYAWNDEIPPNAHTNWSYWVDPINPAHYDDESDWYKKKALVLVAPGPVRAMVS